MSRNITYVHCDFAKILGRTTRIVRRLPFGDVGRGQHARTRRVTGRPVLRTFHRSGLAGARQRPHAVSRTVSRHVRVEHLHVDRGVALARPVGSFASVLGRRLQCEHTVLRINQCDETRFFLVIKDEYMSRALLRLLQGLVFEFFFFFCYLVFANKCRA